MLQVSAAEEQRPVIAVLSRSSTKGDVIIVVPEEDTIDHGVLWHRTTTEIGNGAIALVRKMYLNDNEQKNIQSKRFFYYKQ